MKTKRGYRMTLKIKTTTGTINAEVKNKIDAARFLRDLHQFGIKCIRWEVVK